MGEQGSFVKENKMADFGRKPVPDWDELDNEGKIKRLSKIVDEQNILLGELVDYLNQLVDHDHLGGKIVQPIGNPTVRLQATTLPARWIY